MLPACASHRRHDRLVREDGFEFAVVIGNVVRSQQGALAVDRNRQTVRIVRTGVEQKRIADAENLSVCGQRHFGVVHLSAFLRRREKVFLPIFRPLERPAEPDRRPRDDAFFGIEHHDLRPEAAADERCDHLDLRFEQAEHLRQTVANGNWRLRRVPDRQFFRARIPSRDDRPILDRSRNPAVVMKTPRNNDVGRRARGRVVTLCLNDMGGQVRGKMLVDERRV